MIHHKIDPQQVGLSNRDARLSVLRLDKLHPVASGNKLFKLKGHLEQAREQGANTLLSFGGSWSNHLHALAWVAKEQGFDAVGYIRGEPRHTAMIDDCLEWGMQLEFLSYGDYRKRHDPCWSAALLERHDNAWLVPEGGGGVEGALYCREILQLLEHEWDTLLIACGTGTTLAGIASGLPGGKRVLGLPVLPAVDWMQQQVENLLQNLPGDQKTDNWQLLHGYHRQGFGRADDQLLDFISRLQLAGLPLEPVYTGKLLIALEDLYHKEVLADDEKVVLVHTGGLQGRRGFVRL